MSSKKIDLNKTGEGRGNANDRKYQHEAKPSSGSDNRAEKGSASGGAGSSSPNADAKKNGMNVILGLAAPEKTPAFERTATPKSKTPNKAVQQAKRDRTNRENGNYDRSGGWGKQ